MQELLTFYTNRFSEAMRDRKERFVLDTFAADIDANYADWQNEGEQEDYLREIASRIGWIIIEFNRLEWQITEVLSQYLCSDGEMSSIHFEFVSTSSFSSKVDLLKKFYKLYINGEKKDVFDSNDTFQDWEVELGKLIDNLKSLSIIRNQYAHCFWHGIEEDKFVEFKKKFDAKEGLQKVMIRFNNSDLSDDFDKIDAIQDQLFNFDSAFNEIYTSS